MKKVFFKIVISLTMVLIFCIISLSMVFITNQVFALSSEHSSESRSFQPASIKFYVNDDDDFSDDENLDEFLLRTPNDARIEVVFELQYENIPKIDLKTSLNSLSGNREIDNAIARQRTEAQEFYSTKNNAFLNEQNFFEKSENYTITISEYSPQIILTFESLSDFERYSQNIEATLSSQSLPLIIVVEAMEFEDCATRVKPGNADVPNYPMANVFQDTGILNNTFIGRGINVGMIELGTPQDRDALNGVIINRGGSENQLEHATNVAKTFVGNNGIAPGVAALHSYALTNIDTGTNYLIDAMNWLLQPARNIRVINNSWGITNRWGSSNRGAYQWSSAFFDWHVRNSHVTIIKAAGNDGDIDNLVTQPGTGYNVITVGATDANNNISTYSSFGVNAGLNMRKPTLSAPGTWLETTWEGPNCCSTLLDRAGDGCSGTSYATPIVSGVVARLMEEFPILQTRPDIVQAALIASATPVNGQIVGTWDAEAGAGRVHYERARQAVRNAFTFENAIKNGNGTQIRLTQAIAVVPNNQVRVVAFWMANSSTSDNSGNNAVFQNIHTNYDLQVRNATGESVVASSIHNSNIEILWHTPTTSQLVIELVQMANMNANNTQTDIGVVTWIYEESRGIFNTVPVSGGVSITGYATDGTPIGNIEIPSIINGQSVVEISANAFNGQTQLTQISIPVSVTVVGSNAFSNCSNLTINILNTSIPTGWVTNWNPNNRPILFNGFPCIHDNKSFVYFNQTQHIHKCHDCRKYVSENHTYINHNDHSECTECGHEICFGTHNLQYKSEFPLETHYQYCLNCDYRTNSKKCLTMAGQPGQVRYCIYCGQGITLGDRVFSIVLPNGLVLVSNSPLNHSEISLVYEKFGYQYKKYSFNEYDYYDDKKYISSIQMI